MDYNQTVEFLFSQLPAYHRIGKAAYKNNLDNTHALDDHFNHPHLKFRSLHIAGTNGKGSVSHMLAATLQEAGYSTGLYTSPHLVDFRERIKINGNLIPEKAVIEFVEKNRSVIESVKPSFFEMTVAMAFDFFATEKVDVAVIETGLGGRLDSTNIITPVLSVITNIGHDHMDLLGDTFEKIASEKAGIIKPGIPVVIGETQEDTAPVFRSKAQEMNCEIKFADQNYRCQLLNGNAGKGEWDFVIKTMRNEAALTGVTVLGGDYQKKNLVTVYQSASMISDEFEISENNIRDGIRKVIINTGLSGRWQILGHSPLLICDTGHNREGLEYVVGQLAGIPRRKLHIVLGFVSDKDLSLVLPLFPQDAEYYFTKASVTRALDEKKLKKEAEKYNLEGRDYPDVKTAINAARKNASDKDVIFIGGSTFIVADCLSEIQELLQTGTNGPESQK
jgi:dihydrofolate synthase/folylpolyglutamate synthase